MLGRQRHALLDGGREKHPAAAVGLQRQLARRVPLQPRCSGPASASLSLVGDLGALPDVGRSAHRALAGQARGQGAAAGERRRRARYARSSPAACRGCARSSARATTLLQYLSLTRLRIAHHRARDPLLGHRRPADRVRHQQRPLRRARRAAVNVWPVTYLMLQAVEGSRHALLLHRRHALRRRTRSGASATPTSTASTTRCRCANPTDWLSKFTAIAFVEIVLLAITMLVRHRHADHRRLLPLRAAAIRQGTVRRHLPADARLRPVRHVRADHGVEQVHRPRHRHRALRPAADPVQLRLGEHALPPGAAPPYTYSDMNGYGHFVPALFWSHHLLVRRSSRCSAWSRSRYTRRGAG